MMHHGLVMISVALLSLSLAVSCGKARPPATQNTSAAAVSPSVPSEPPVPPEASAPIEVPRLAMKSIASEGQPNRRSSPADPLLPNGSEAPRLPLDFVIGPIGSEGVDPAIYRFAFNFLTALARADDVSSLYSDRGRQDAAAVDLLLAPIIPASVHLGSGVIESDGDASFSIRFIGKERSASGELHLIRSPSSWLVDELILDEPVVDYGADGAARFDPFTYTRFL